MVKRSILHEILIYILLSYSLLFRKHILSLEFGYFLTFLYRAILKKINGV